ADGQNSYVYASGTSMSCPSVAGAAAVLTQYLVEEKDMDDPSPAMIKASLINGARPLSGYEYPNNVQGWGTVDMVRTLFEDESYTIYRDDQSVDLDTSGGEDEQSYWFMVESDTPLKVTLVWTDMGGTSGTGKALINDLDLELIAPDGTRYAGNLFSNGQSVADDTYYQDRTNPVEGFLLNSPAQGIWTINVKCFNAPSGPQDYALVVSGNAQKGHIDLVPTVFSAGPEGMEEFETGRITSTLKNLGNRGIEVFDYLLEQVDPDGVTTTLSAGNHTDLGAGLQTQMAWDFTGKRGTHKLRLTLDPDDLLRESNETNNVVEVEYFFKGYDVRVATSESEMHTDPSFKVDFTVDVRNLGNVADTMSISITAAPPGWSADIASETFLLNAGQSTGVTVSVIPPSNATAGETADITFTAKSQGNAAKTHSITLRTVVNQIFGLELTAPVDHLELLPGEEADYTLRIRNPGNGVDRYEILVPTGIASGWWGSIPEAYVTVDVRSHSDAAFRLAAPTIAMAGSSLEFTLRVKSTKSDMEMPVTLSAEILQFYENDYEVIVRDVEGEVGTTVTVPVTIENNGNGRVDYVLSAMATQDTWEAGFAVPSVTIEGYEFTSVEMTFTVPEDATAETHTLTIFATPTGGEELVHEFNFSVLQYHGLAMEVTSEDATVTQGGAFEVDVRVTNLGNGVEDVKVLVPDLPAFWSFDLEDGDLEIEPFGQIDLTVTVHTNKDTEGGDYLVGLLARYGPDRSTTGATAHVTLLTRPDLIVRNGVLTASSVDVMEGDLITFSLDIENTGQTAAEDVYVQFYLDGLPYGQPLYLASVGPGEVQNLTNSWLANITGLHEISVDVDSTKNVDETKEGNNHAALQVNVEPVEYQTSPGPGLLMALVAIAVLALVAVRRRSRRA
ncbi:MAG: S8 family serine peptidase, partial [Thermoplasmata archaeon]